MKLSFIAASDKRILRALYTKYNNRLVWIIRGMMFSGGKQYFGEKTLLRGHYVH